MLEFPGEGEVVPFEVKCLVLKKACPPYVLFLLAQYQNTLIDPVYVYLLISIKTVYRFTELMIPDGMYIIGCGAWSLPQRRSWERKSSPGTRCWRHTIR